MKNYAAQFLYAPASWFQLLDWQLVFGNTHPVEIDLGCGDGTFLVQRAGRYPERNFVGVDRLLGRARKVDRKAQRLGLMNVRALRIESSYAVGYLFPPGSVTVCHIYFPDPWPKKRHQKRRLLQPEFVGALGRAVACGGEVRIATDHEEYFEEIRALFAGSNGWAEYPLEEPLPEERTDFEQEFVKAEKTIHRIGFKNHPSKAEVAQAACPPCDRSPIVDSQARDPLRSHGAVN